MTAALLEVPGRAAEVLAARRGDPGDRAAGVEGAGRAVPGARQLLPDRAWRGR